MPQTFHVLQCADCKTFQVHIVKKSSNKWQCKICSTKQSVVKTFTEGTGSECRVAAQKLNFVRGTTQEKLREEELLKSTTRESENQTYNEEEEATENYSAKVKPVSEFNIGIYDSEEEEEEENQEVNLNIQPSTSSKWTKYLDIENSSPEVVLD